MRPIVSRTVIVFAFVFAALGVSGCGTRRYDVKGQVKYNGEPLRLPLGTVVFVGPDGSQVSATIDEETGSYWARQVLAGSNKVAVYYNNPKAGKVLRKEAKQSPNAKPPPPFLTPEKYASTETSQLAKDVNEDTEFIIELTGPPLK